MATPEKTVEALVTADILTWHEPIEGTVPLQQTHHGAYKGDVVTMPESAFDRAVAAGGAVKAGKGKPAAKAKAGSSKAEAQPEGDVGDAVIRAMSEADRIAYVGQFPDEQVRVNAINTEDGIPLMGVDENGDPIVTS